MVTDVSLFQILLGFGFFGLISLMLQRRGVNYRDRVPLLAVYNFITSFILIVLYRNLISNYVVTPGIFEFILLVITIIVFFLLGNIINKRFPISKVTKLKYKHTYVFDFDNEYMITKISDVFFQQSLVFVLISYLLSKNLHVVTIIFIFSIIFVSIHIVLILFMGNIAWSHVLLSFFPSIIFAFLILNFRYGYLYAYCLHLLSYLLFRSLIWRKFRSKI